MFKLVRRKAFEFHGLSVVSNDKNIPIISKLVRQIISHNLEIVIDPLKIDRL